MFDIKYVTEVNVDGHLKSPILRLALAINNLAEAIREEKQTVPDEILEKLDEIIINVKNTI